jgi:hypothetical protein
MANARFWIFHRDGWVKLTLAPGASLSFSYGGATDEGWSRHSETLSHDGSGIVSEACEDGVDCDGRLTRYGVYRCALDKLASRDCSLSDAPGLLPEWESISSRQRDEYAESMNY